MKGVFKMKKLIILIAVAFGVTLISNSNEYVEIPSSSIRMRVIANSNDKGDQENKKFIKSIVEEKLYDIVNSSKNYSSVDEAIEKNRDEIDETIRKAIVDNNMNVEFASSYGMNYFPEKEYRGLSYKAGNYKSYVVTLGEGEGDNWWCVLYPPLCMVNENVEDYEYHYLIKEAIEKYN